MEKEEETTKTRRPYHKPELEQVQLVAEEAVLAGCKRGDSCMDRTQSPPRKLEAMGT